MRWVPDQTGRFPQRPYYEQAELDHICERAITEFLIDKYGHLTFPITTNDLTILIERDAEMLDLYADLQSEGADVEGVTDFIPGRKPRVRIAAELYNDAKREHRLRTTLTHEYGHVHLHNALYSLERSLPLFGDQAPAHSPTCKRATILQAPVTDWLEWQAGYACGSLLMPITALRGLAQAILAELGVYGSIAANTPAGSTLITRVTQEFHVSTDAARVRLSQLRYLADYRRGQALGLG